MNSEWQVKSLGDLADIHQKQVNPAHSPAQVFRHFSLPAYDIGQAPIKEPGSAIGSQKFSVPAGSVLVSKLNPRITRVWYPKVTDDFPAIASTEFLVLRPKQDVDGRFLKYVCLSPSVLSEMKSRATGTSGSHQRVRPEDALKIEVDVPVCIEEQQAISRVLGSLDDRIDNNRALAANLEAIARRLFKSWFVDFDPVRAKAAGEKPLGLADDIAALFPDRFEDSELGEIPEGWQQTTLAATASLNPETWTTRKHPNEIDYLDLSNVKDGVIEAPTKYSWDDAPSRARRVLQQGDTIIGTVRPGNRSFALIDEVGFTGSTGFAVLRPLSNVNREFLYIAATNDDAIERLAHLADGAAYPAVRPEVVLATEIIIPSDEVMTAFSAVTKGMVDRASVCKQESNVLAEIRDLLLPRLISGKLRVGDAESTIEEAIA